MAYDDLDISELTQMNRGEMVYDVSGQSWVKSEDGFWRQMEPIRYLMNEPLTNQQLWEFYGPIRIIISQE